MAVTSMAVYLEECVYIYRKVPSNKKGIIAWVNGAAPVIGTLSCLGMWIPRATMFTDMTYFAVVVFKFLVLMLEEVGGDQAFLARAPKHQLKISTGPCCCCCPCLPHLHISGAAIWINPFVGVLTIIALWPVAIMFMHLRVTLRSIKIIPKYAMYQLILVLTQLQSTIINILAMNGTIACAPPYSSPARGYMMSQQLLILEMFIITLVTRLLYRRHYEPLSQEENDSEIKENTKMITEP
ncbi:hypothetical protein NHX12_021267 [Muraenolepis orangiensis]|uniref:Organic solute transporter subunit alpha n=1 Tax=Muraenolepis orangiensis TaxID=630683 RepID=A0A9Q0ESR1_9TELE|nr:hypothetical protein NHX12_021267 [Muraenolepis orangiensis]